jgi:Skp family chaperone for outer membrane proteins
MKIITMKMKTFLTGMTLALALVPTLGQAQDAQECIAMVSLFTEPAKAKKLSRSLQAL